MKKQKLTKKELEILQESFYKLAELSYQIQEKNKGIKEWFMPIKQEYVELLSSHILNNMDFDPFENASRSHEDAPGLTFGEGVMLGVPKISVVL